MSGSASLDHGVDLIADPARLAALDRYGILDTPPEQEFEDVVLLASQLCRTPVALVTFVAADRQWFKARVGFAPCETDLSRSVCAHGLAHPSVLVIPDLTTDPRTRDNPLVTGEPHIRFYAGARLETPSGEPLGMLCVIDTEPRPQGLTPVQTEALEALARQVMVQLELGRSIRVIERTLAERDQLWSMPNLLLANAAFDSTIVAVSPGWRAMLGWSEDELIGRSYAELIHPDDAARSLEWAARLAAGEEVEELENRYRAKDGSYRCIAWTITRGDGVFHCVGRDMTTEKEQARSLARIEEQLRQA